MLSFFTLLVAVLPLIGSSDAFWRLSCAIIQESRIDPVLFPGEVSPHVHKVAGAQNINPDSDYDSLQQASCTSCSIQADKSAYWTPTLYYQHGNGTFEKVGNTGMTVYYLGRGDNMTAQPFPEGFRMVSGDPYARSYDPDTLTAPTGGRPVSDRVSFACLNYADEPPQTTYMNQTDCPDGMRAQIQFQSCWDGVNLYEQDQSHVAYLSQIDNGVCPDTHPVLLPHLFFEVLYSMDSVTQDGGQFVFAQGDPTGYGFHGDFLNGWDIPTLQDAITNCLTLNPSGVVDDCSSFDATNDDNFADDCPEQPPLVDEPYNWIDPLPGCNPVQYGPAEATQPAVCPTSATFTTPTGTKQTTMTPTPSQTFAGGWVYAGCANEPSSGTRALNSQSYSMSNMTTESCLNFCASYGYTLAGTEYFDQCYCADSFTPGASLGQTGCDFACYGNQFEICGGSDRLSIYNRTSASVSITTTSASLTTSRSSTTTGPTTTLSPTPGQNFSSGWQYVGCAKELSTGRALSGISASNTSMTVEMCQQYCSSNGYGLAGLEYSEQCFCDNTLPAAATLGQTGCTMPCDGNTLEICGGMSLLSVYNLTTFDFPGEPAAIVAPATGGNFKYRGCYTDNAISGRTLTGAFYYDTANLTLEHCVNFCAAQGYSMAGAEYQEQCFCGNALSNGGTLNTDQTQCNLLCTGNLKEYCGGSSLLSLFALSNYTMPSR